MRVPAGFACALLLAALTLDATARAQQPVPPAAPAAPQRQGGPPAAQGRGGGPPLAPQAAAPIDLTGNWVAVISEDWRWRMVTPAKGDYASIPLTQAGKNAADLWDPARDAAAGEQCKSYGAAGIMRAPTRLRISWQDERTLKVETDYGTQTRLLSFGPPPAGAQPSWQGTSVAQWELAGRGRGAPPMFGNLKVVTTNMRPGYLRKNGVPYSADATLTEYWDLFVRGNGDRWIVITSIVHDPVNLQTDWITSLNFKKEADGAKWDPTPCSTTW
jgi:hypothetical protein